MSQFVNYNKRTITLPPGCKNLIDVLKSQDSPGSLTPALTEGIACGGTVRARLSEMTRYVHMAYQSRGLLFSLAVSPVDERFSFEITLLRDSIWSAAVLVPLGTGPEAAVRSFFLTRKLKLPEQKESISPFYPQAPVYLILTIEPMPPDAITLAQFAKDLFREVCALNDSSEVTYRHEELIDGA